MYFLLLGLNVLPLHRQFTECVLGPPQCFKIGLPANQLLRTPFDAEQFDDFGTGLVLDPLYDRPLGHSDIFRFVKSKQKGTTPEPRISEISEQIATTSRLKSFSLKLWKSIRISAAPRNVPQKSYPMKGSNARRPDLPNGVMNTLSNGDAFWRLDDRTLLAGKPMFIQILLP